MADITLQQAQQMVDSWIKTYGVRYFNELTNMTILTEEMVRAFPNAILNIHRGSGRASPDHGTYLR